MALRNQGTGEEERIERKWEWNDTNCVIDLGNGPFGEKCLPTHSPIKQTHTYIYI